MEVNSILHCKENKVIRSYQIDKCNKKIDVYNELCKRDIRLKSVKKKLCNKLADLESKYDYAIKFLAK